MREREISRLAVDHDLSLPRDPTESRLLSDRRRDIDSALEQCAGEKAHLLDQVSKLDNGRQNIEGQLQQIHSGGERLIEGFNALDHMAKWKYGDGAGPKIEYDNGKPRISKGQAFVVGKDKFLNTDLVLDCATATFRALEVSNKGKIPYRDQGGQRFLDLHEPNLFEFYKLWVNYDNKNSIEVKGPIAAIESTPVPIGMELKDPMKVERGDIVQEWYSSKRTKEGVDGHQDIVKDVKRDGSGELVVTLKSMTKERGIAEETVVWNDFLRRGRITSGEDPNRRVYVGRLYDNVSEDVLQHEASLQNDREETLRALRAAKEHIEEVKRYEGTIRQVAQSNRLNDLPDYVFGQLRAAVPPAVVREDQYPKVAEFLERLPELFPNGAIRDEIATAVFPQRTSAPILPDRATLERHVLEDLGHSETSINAMEDVGRKIHESIPAKTFENREKRWALEDQATRYALDTQIARELVRDREWRTLATTIGRVQQVIDRYANQLALGAIGTHLAQLADGPTEWERLGLTKETWIDLESRLAQIRSEVTNAWKRGRS